MTENAQSAANPPQGQFAVQKIYIKDISFETPHSPQIFREKEWNPNVNVELHTKTQKLEENTYEVVLILTVTAKLGDKSAYLVEAQQAGIFNVSGFADQDMTYMLGSYCPNMLFPFAREAVAELVSKGGFPQLLLAPVNFDALLAQKLQEQQAQQPAAH